MHLYYLTHDEVNVATARQLVGQFRQPLTLIDVDLRQFVWAAGRVVIDLDSLPPEFKTGLLDRAASADALSGVAVHSYHLTADETLVLRTAGAVVGRRLTARLFVVNQHTDALRATVA